jgi:large subunit ribosomal protein L24
MLIRKNDQVVIIAGDDKDAAPRKVLRVLPQKGKIVVEGVNRVYKHMRPSQRNQQGGRLSKEMPIDASNALLYCPSCNRGVRVGHQIDASGQKHRHCRKCNTNLGAVGPAKPTRARTASASAK